MDRKYWEKIAPDYNEEIFDVLYNDKKNIIRSAIGKLASPSATVIDIGCAVGKWLPILSPVFKKVIAVDISEKNLETAKSNYPDLTNVEYQRVDMSVDNIQLPKSDVAVCINAILTDSLKKRSIFFSNLAGCLKKRGSLILVVPSLESWLCTRIIQNQWQIDKKLFTEKIPDEDAAKKYYNILQGNADIDNVPTKHYLREELGLLLAREGFVMKKCEKIEYSWNTEFVDAPEWLTEPRPWDWMVVAKKGK
ncbi:MAG TPA: class I SAM-dependent methyltransferase [Chitinophagaceae bacterium]|nr:class I SAM-dependent methyltransferase [Chitinophagaceae bacterium]